LAYYTFITPALIIYNVFDELLWSTNGDNIYLKCLEIHNFFINKSPLHSTLLHPDANGDLCGHFSNLYVTLHLEDFDFFPNAFTFTFVVDVNNEVFSSVPTIVTVPIFHSTFDDVVFANSHVFKF
jgi:hypothetical protein